MKKKNRKSNAVAVGVILASLTVSTAGAATGAVPSEKTSLAERIAAVKIHTAAAIEESGEAGIEREHLFNFLNYFPNNFNNFYNFPNFRNF